MMKLFKSMVVGMICVMAILSLGSCSRNHMYSAAAVVDSTAIINEQKVKGESEVLISNLRIPVVSGLKDKKIEKEVNEILKADVIKFRGEVEKAAKEAYENSIKYGGDFYQKYVVETMFKVRYNKGRLLSITVLYHQYTGGAHGIEVQNGYTFDLRSGKLLALSDLFPRDYDYSGIISTYILDYIKGHPQDYFPEAISSFKNITGNQPFYLEEGNVVIYYGEYEIAPYAAGIPEFRIPFSKLKFNCPM